MSDQLNIAAIVLAAGRSTRMGDVNKLLIDIDGQPILIRTMAQVKAAGISPTLVVTGHQAEKVQELLGDLTVDFIHNEIFRDGMATSIVAGIGALGAEIDGVLIVLGDMPLVGGDDMAALLASFKNRSDICVPVCNGIRGNPVLWGCDYFEQLQSLKGDKGAKDLIKLHGEQVVEVEMSGDGVLRDFDDKESLATIVL